MNLKMLDFEKPIVELENKIEELKNLEKDGEVDFSPEIASLEVKLKNLKEDLYQNLGPWQMTQIARHLDRPIFPDYVSNVFSDFIEIHGDRLYSDDRALIGGFAQIDNHKVMLIGEQRGKDLKENLRRNHGMPHPEGYRKAIRLMKLAEKFNKPIITFIDTAGAYPGIGAEERGQGEAIAKNLYEMVKIKVPIISLVTGQGGSGGALAIGVGDRLLMQEFSVYSVITPEGCATILWRDAAKAPEAAVAMKMVAGDLYELGICDEIIKEPLGGAHKEPKVIYENTKKAILKNLNQLIKIPEKKLLDQRFEKYMKIGFYTE